MNKANFVNQFIKIISLFIIYLTLANCQTYKLKPNKNNIYKKIAVLPVVNISNNVAETSKLQSHIHKRLRHIHYQVKPLQESNNFLRDNYSLTLGKQLADYTPQELASALEVEGLIYIYLLNADTIIATSNLYRIGIKFVDGKTGKIIFGKGIGVQTQMSDNSTLKAITLIATLTKQEFSKFPTSDNPKIEMPGIYKWHYIDLISNKSNNNLKKEFLISLIANAVASALDISFNRERDIVLDDIFCYGVFRKKNSYRFPVGAINTVEDKNLNNGCSS